MARFLIVILAALVAVAVAFPTPEVQGEGAPLVRRARTPDVAFGLVSGFGLGSGHYHGYRGGHGGYGGYGGFGGYGGYGGYGHGGHHYGHHHHHHHHGHYGFH